VLQASTTLFGLFILCSCNNFPKVPFFTNILPIPYLTSPTLTKSRLSRHTHLPTYPIIAAYIGPTPAYRPERQHLRIADSTFHLNIRTRAMSI